MKKEYQNPKSTVIELGTEVQLCDVSNLGEGEGEFDVKASRRGFSWDDEDED